MENGEKKEIIFGVNEDLDPEDVPEQYREMVKAKLEAVKAGKETPGASKITAHKDFQFKFQGGSGLETIFNLLLKASQPPGPRARPPSLQSRGAAASEERQEARGEQPNPGAVKPSSSGWLIWLIAIILAAAYLISSGALLK